MKTHIFKFIIIALVIISSGLSIPSYADEGDGNGDGNNNGDGSSNNNNDPQSYDRSYWQASNAADYKKYTSWGYTNSDGTTGTVTGWGNNHASDGSPGSPGSPPMSGACHVVGYFGIDCAVNSHNPSLTWCYKTGCGGHGATCYPDYQCDPPVAAVPPTPPTPPTFSIQLNDPGKTPSVHDTITRTTISTHVDPQPSTHLIVAISFLS